MNEYVFILWGKYSFGTITPVNSGKSAHMKTRRLSLKARCHQETLWYCLATCETVKARLLLVVFNKSYNLERQDFGRHITTYLRRFTQFRKVQNCFALTQKHQDPESKLQLFIIYILHKHRIHKLANNLFIFQECQQVGKQKGGSHVATHPVLASVLVMLVRQTRYMWVSLDGRPVSHCCQSPSLFNTDNLTETEMSKWTHPQNSMAMLMIDCEINVFA